MDELIAALRAEGHEVVLVGPTRTGDVRFGEVRRSAGMLRRRLPRWLYEVFELAYGAVSFVRLVRAIRRQRPDAIYERYQLFSLSGVLASRATGVPLVLEVNSPLFEERATLEEGVTLHRLARWSQRACWRGADAVLPVSEAMAGYVRRVGVPDERITVLHNGINLTRFAGGALTADLRRELGIDDRLVLGFTGFVHAWHQLDRVVTLLPFLADHCDVHLLVVGDGKARSDLERQASASGVADRVSITGTVERGEIPTYTGAFDIALQVGVTPYASPLKLFEYMAMSRAIVAPASENIREVLSDGIDALLFDPADDADLADAILRLAGDPDLRAHLGAGARRTIDSKGLTWTANARRIADIVSALQHKPPQRPARAQSA